MTELHLGSGTPPTGSNPTPAWAAKSLGAPHSRGTSLAVQGVTAPFVTGSSHEYTLHASSTSDDPRIPCPPKQVSKPGPPAQGESDPSDPPPRRSFDEFWLAPLIVVVLIVWLRLALDALGILPLNLGQ